MASGAEDSPTFTNVSERFCNLWFCHRCGSVHIKLTEESRLVNVHYHHRPSHLRASNQKL